LKEKKGEILKKNVPKTLETSRS